MHIRTRSFTVDSLASTTPRLLLWLLASVLLALGVYALSQAKSIRPFHIETWAMIVPSIPATFAFTIYSLTALQREHRRAIDKFWGPFSQNACIYLPSSDLNSLPESKVPEPSPFTPYHDAAASWEVQSYLRGAFDAVLDIGVSDHTKEIHALGRKTTILIGGSNFNTLTEQFMAELWAKKDMPIFHWIKTVSADASTRSLSTLADDHLLLIDRLADPPIVLDQVCDVSDLAAHRPSHARGMIIWAKDIVPGTTILLLAGVDSAYGTLAAARYFLNPKNLPREPDRRLLQIIVSAPVRGYDIDEPSLMRAISL
ncbi:MAG: hypothetical protein ACLQVN_19360 [Bryobacteraceae bacterium]